MSNLARLVYRFGSDVVDGDASMNDVLGGKGAGLAEMTLLSAPVPPGFTISTETCRFTWSMEHFRQVCRRR